LTSPCRLSGRKSDTQSKIIWKNFLKRCRESGTSSDYRLKRNPVPEKIQAPDAALKEKTSEEPMTALTPYLLFDGNCKQAMEFYHSCFGGEITQLPVKD